MLDPLKTLPGKESVTEAPAGRARLDEKRESSQTKNLT
jgi:hypothetical protein